MNPQASDPNPTQPDRETHADTGPGVPAPAGGDDSYRRVSRVTPLVSFWQGLVALLFIIVLNIGDSVRKWLVATFHEDDGSGGILREALVDAATVLGALAVITLLVLLVSRVWWKATGYRIDTVGDEVAVKKGVFFKEQRSARFSRIQAVDVVETLLPRILGLAEVRVETAGGNDSSLTIAFLKRAEAYKVREEILNVVHSADSGDAEARVALERFGPGGAQGAHASHPADADAGAAAAAGKQGLNGRVAEGDAAQVPPVPGGAAGPAVVYDPVTPGLPGTGGAGEILVPEIPTQRSMIAAVLMLRSWVGVLVAAAGLIGNLGLAGLIPILLAAGGVVKMVLEQSWRYTAIKQGRVMTISYGLTQRRSQNINIDRIHAMEVSQPLLWRVAGWYRVQVSVAGYGLSKKTGTSTAVLPVGTFEDVVRLLAVISPLDQAQVRQMLTPGKRDGADLVCPRRARWVDFVTSRFRAAWVVGERAIVVHRGVITRRAAVVAPRHIQELTLTVGPVQRRLRLSSVRLDLVGGPVSMSMDSYDEQQMRALVARLRQRRLPPLEGATEPKSSTS